VRNRRRLGARTHVQLREDPRHVHAGRLLGHVEPLADLAVRRAGRHQRQHVALAGCQAEGVLGLVAAGLGRSGRGFALAQLEPRACGERLHLVHEPRTAEASRAGERLRRGGGRGRALACGHQRLGEPPAGIGA
jgi:hypothetical protein